MREQRYSGPEQAVEPGLVHQLAEEDDQVMSDGEGTIDEAPVEAAVIEDETVDEAPVADEPAAEEAPAAEAPTEPDADAPEPADEQA